MMLPLISNPRIFFRMKISAYMYIYVFCWAEIYLRVKRLKKKDGILQYFSLTELIQQKLFFQYF